MTLREVMRGWALRHRDAGIERVQTDRALVLTARHGGGTMGEIRALQLRQYRNERRLMFWDDLAARLAPPANGGHLPGAGQQSAPGSRPLRVDRESKPPQGKRPAPTERAWK